MKQVVQKLKDGKIAVVELPSPHCGENEVLIKNAYSVISAGTELSTVSAARSSLLGKAKARPEQVKQVLDSIETNGLELTLRAVDKRLNTYSSLGYSCSGQIIAVGEKVSEFKVGDYVAAAGISYAVHASEVSVPKSLVVKVPDPKKLDQACFNAIAAIALQAIRVSTPQLGSLAAIIGFGLIGQILFKLLRANGVEVAVFELDDHNIELARKLGCKNVFSTKTSSNIDKTLNSLTHGNGFDNVYICASTTSDEPINLAGHLARKKGNVIVVGDVGNNFSRDPYFYKKELNILLSCSYGPGRYDNSYEEKCIDYPFPYVRWTENRNMQTIQNLIAEETINLSDLITHIFNIDDAIEAYDLLYSGKEKFTAILIKYDFFEETLPTPSKVYAEYDSLNSNDGICFIGPGSYAQSQILPYLAKNKLKLKSVVSGSGSSSLSIIQKYKVPYQYTDYRAALDHDPKGVFIAPRHNLHFPVIKYALMKQIKNIYVEKPLCLTSDELDYIVKNVNSETNLIVGFNREFSPHSTFVKKHLPSNPKNIIYRVNAGYVPEDSWIHDINEGGGRIIGEVCHFFQLCSFFFGSKILRVNSVSTQTLNIDHDYIFSLEFSCGGIATVIYSSSGANKIGKEYIEIHGDQFSFVIDNFQKTDFWLNKQKKSKQHKTRTINKGQSEFFRLVVKSFKENNLLQNVDSLVNITDATFSAVKALEKKSWLKVLR